MSRPDALPATGRTVCLGIVGDPVDHSLSPRLHEALLSRAGVDGRYVPFPVPAEDLPEAIAGVRALGIRGVNVTVPHKVAVASLVDGLEGDARIVGAVNTVLREDDGRLVGLNTDVGGLVRAMGAWYRSLDRRAEGTAIVLGAGGAARAAVLALLRLGHAPVHVAARRHEAAERLVEDLRGSAGGSELTPLGLSELDRAAQARVVVNATPCGLGALRDASPWPEGVDPPAGAALADLVYGSEPTPFQRLGSPSCDGIAMLVHQGALALSIWCGTDLPTDDESRELEEMLGAGLRREGEGEKGHDA